MKVKIADLKGTHLESYALKLEALAEEMRNHPKRIKALGFQMCDVLRRMAAERSQ
jgi:hypothetical protein